MSCLVLLIGKVLFCLIVSVLSATAEGPDTHAHQLPDTRETHTEHARYRHGQAEANTWARTTKGQHFAARTERTRRVSISGENGYFCI